MWVDAGALISKAYNVKWSQTAINNMKWDGTDEWLDQTADCTSNSPGGDKLRIGSYSTNIPNFGLSMFDDCGNIPGYREEAELTLNAHSISSTTNYWFQMQWDCVYGGASGEINISFEANSFSHDWLDKVNYGCLYGSPAEGSESQNTPQASNPPNDKLQRESLARVDGPLY